MRNREELRSFINKGLAGNSLARKICEVDKLAPIFEWPTEVKPITIKKEAKKDCIWEDDNEQIDKVIHKEIIDPVSKNETKSLMDNIINIEEIPKEKILGKLIQLTEQGHAIIIHPSDYNDIVLIQKGPATAKEVIVNGIDSRINAQKCKNIPIGIILIQNPQNIPIMKVKENANADAIKNASKITIHYWEHIWFEEVGRLNVIKIRSSLSHGVSPRH